MNRRQAAQADQWAAQDAAGNPVCQLCGKATIVFVDPADEAGEQLATFDLCGDCNRAFSELAQALATAQDARELRAELVDQVEGQLELEEPAHDNGTYHATVAQSVQVLDALRRGGSFDGVPSIALVNVRRDDHGSGGALLNDRERLAILDELGRRA